MKIAQVIWPDYSMPPYGYGSIQLVASRIVNGLVDKGYDITSFTTADSKIKGKIVPTAKIATKLDKTVSDFELFHAVTLLEVIKRKKDFDIFHCHIGYFSLVLLDVMEKPLVITLHSDISEDKHFLDIYQKYGQKAFFVAISKSQKKNLSGINCLDVVYHGLDINEYYFEEDAEDYMVFVGRISPGKNLGEAIRIAMDLKIPLKIAAKMGKSPEAVKYYEKEIKPFLDNRYIDFLGELNQEEVKRLISKAKVFIYPINWAEPFGLVVMEANASGIPVVTYSLGAMPELIKNGLNGFVLEPRDLEGFKKAIKKIFRMPKQEYDKMKVNCRDFIKANFSIEKMVEGYENVYKNVMAIWRKRNG